MSDGVEHTEVLVWQLALCLLLVWMVVYMVLINGIKSLGKVRPPPTINMKYIIKFFRKVNILVKSRRTVSFVLYSQWCLYQSQIICNTVQMQSFNFLEMHGDFDE